MTPDVNILVAASRIDHPHHIAALSWLNDSLLYAEKTNQSLYILPMVASGFLRLVTHRKIFVNPTPYLAAQSFIRAILQAPNVIMPLLGKEWPIFDQICETYLITGNDIPDAWIAASVISNNDHLVSFDKGFLRFLQSNQFTLLRP